MGVMAGIVSLATSSSSTPFHSTSTFDVKDREAGTEEGGVRCILRSLFRETDNGIAWFHLVRVGVVGSLEGFSVTYHERTDVWRIVF